MALRTSAVATLEAGAATQGERDGCATVAVYSDLESEYKCVRQRVGLQDLSHYGKIAVTGDAALDLINQLILTDLARLPINELQASFVLDDAGRPVCDVLIANLGSSYLLLSEGAAPAAVAAILHAKAAAFPGTTVEDRTESLGLLSLDGPYSWELLKVFVGLGIIGTRYREVVPAQSIAGANVTICRAGKTGEYGYLLLAAASETPALWTSLKQAGEKFALLPVGTQAADLCKLENRIIGMPAEGRAAANVFELNTRAMFGRDKEDFVGRAALQEVIDTGVARRLVGMSFAPELTADQQGVAPGAAVNFGEQQVGSLVNAGYSFALQRWIGLALIDESYACVGIDYDVHTPQQSLAAATVSAPFLFNRSMTIRPQEDSYFS